MYWLITVVIEQYIQANQSLSIDFAL